MCTLMTLDRARWTAKAERRIRKDADQNPDGFSLLLLDERGGHSLLRTFDIQSVLNMLNTTGWTRMFLHCRYATQGQVRLDNTHGWSSQGVFYMHNGSITSPEARLFPVDSQAIGEWLEVGVDDALTQLRSEPYANVFLIDTNLWYYAVNRSKYGSLFTDGRGNYSTNAFGSVSRHVRRRSQLAHDIPVKRRTTDFSKYTDLDQGWGA